MYELYNIIWLYSSTDKKCIGFISFLLGVGQEVLQNDRNLFGNLLENFIYQELQKQKGWSNTITSLNFMRTVDGDKIDFVMEDNKGKIVAIEVKSSTSINMKDVDKIRKFKDEVGSKFHRGIVLYTGSQVLKVDSSIYFMPVQGLWRERNLV